MKTISCMNIDEKILRSFGGEDKTYNKKEVIYREGENAVYYYQIVTGKVKLNNYDEDGKEFIQNILGENQSFGDSVLFLETFHGMNAVCLSPVELIRLPKKDFFDMLEKHPEISLEMNACLSQRLHFKSVMLQNLASQNPETRLKGLLDYLKSYRDRDCEQCFNVEFTRQELANLVGLRVETVIRALKRMEKQGKIKIENRKLIY